jgi:hypothetical protein
MFKQVTTLALAPAPVAALEGLDCVELTLLFVLAAPSVTRKLPPTPVELEHASVPNGFTLLEKVISAH